MIKGRLIILSIKVDGVFLPVGCLTRNTIEEESEMLNTTTRDNGSWETSRPIMQSYVINFEGLQINTIFRDGDASKASYDRLKTFKRTRALVEWQITGGDTGKGYITSLSGLEPVDGMLSFSCEITGDGVL